MLSIEDILKERFSSFKEDPIGTLKQKSTTYNKDWAKAVDHFRIRINKDRKKEQKPLYSFIVIRQKLAGVKEIDDLRWFYNKCLEYSYTRDKVTLKRNTFSRCFFGALKGD